MRAIRFVVLPLLLVALSGCGSTPATRIKENPEAFARLPAAVQERVRQGRVEVGDDPATVLLARGEPARRMERRDTESGTTEIWIYTSRGPRLSFGVGLSAGNAGSALGVGVSSSTPRRREDDEVLRVEFRGGLVSRVEFNRP